MAVARVPSEDTPSRGNASSQPVSAKVWAGPQSAVLPVITAEAKERITKLIGQGLQQGAELVVDGRGLELQGYEKGFFLGGSLFDRGSGAYSVGDEFSDAFDLRDSEQLLVKLSYRFEI